MRNAVPILLALIALAPVARSGEPERPPRVPEVVEAVKKAFAEKDDPALAAAVRSAGPLTWWVADTLVAEGLADVALGVVAAFQDPSHDALRAYVEREKGLPPDGAARSAVRASEAAFRSRDFPGALRALDGVVGRGLVGLAVLNGRAMVLGALGRLEEASAALAERGRAAAELGWHAAAAQAYERAAAVALERGDEVGRRSLRREVVAAARKAGDDPGLAGALINLAAALDDADPEAEKASEEGLAIARRIGHRAYLANGLVNLGTRRTRNGDLDGAQAALEEGLALQEAVGDVVYAARARAGLAALARRRGDRVTATRLYEEAAAAQEKAGDAAGACASLQSLIDVAFDASDFEGARSAAQRAVALAQRARLATHGAIALGGLARAEAALGRVDAALAAAARAVETARATRVPRAIANALLAQSSVQIDLAEYAPAEATAREAAALSASIGDPSGRARALTLLGNVLGRVGDGEGALAAHREVHAFHAARGRSPDLATATANVGYAHLVRGDAGEALAWTLRARDQWVALGDSRRAAEALQNVASVHLRIGDLERARETLAAAAKEAAAAGDAAGRAAALVNLGAAEGSAEDPGAGRAALEEGLALARASGARLWELKALSNLAFVEDALGHVAEAKARYLDLIGRTETMNLPRERACAFSSLSSLELRGGDPKAALAAAESARAAASASDDPWDRAVGDAAVAGALVALGRPAEALAHVRSGTEALASAVVGVPTTLGVSSSGLWVAMRSTGLEAARATGDVAAAFEVSERSRAGQVLEWVGGRDSVGSAGVPPALAEEERTRRTALLTAQARFARAHATGELAAVRAARAAVEAAEASHLEAVGRIQLEARGTAAVAFPEAPSLEAFRASLPAGTAFVAYAVEERRSLALVVTRDAARMVDLGARAAIESAIEPLLAALSDGGSGDAGAGLAAARDVLLAPLSLGGDVKRLVVAPDGILARVPLPALAPERTVSLVASATAWRMLVGGRRPRGDGVLALGDPVYGGASPSEAGARAAGGTAGDVGLLPLPATRAEAKAVGTTVLLGADATETALSKALSTRSWRAVHLACHGLVDVDRPLRSSLALSSDAESDGYLRVAEVYSLRIPADLVVLSACESGRGRTYSGAGVVGFTNAFLVAGASSVVCSLWKVDDEATQALMRKFYEAWNPASGAGLPAAEALRVAQASIRATKKWEHPYFWAAWVLWGVPD